MMRELEKEELDQVSGGLTDASRAYLTYLRSHPPLPVGATFSGSAYINYQGMVVGIGHTLYTVPSWGRFLLPHEHHGLA
jgi:hypothetical protein